MSIRMLDRCDHVVVGFLHRVAEVNRDEHLDAQLVVKLVEQVNKHVRQRVARALVALEVVQIVRRIEGKFLRGHSQNHGVEHLQRLLPELVVDSHYSNGRCFCGKIVQLQVRIGVSYWRDDVVVCLLDRISETNRIQDGRGRRRLIELVAQQHRLVKGLASGDVGLEMIEARRQQLHVVHKHSGEISEVIQMHQEFDAHGLPRIGRHVHELADPSFCIGGLMEDRLQDVPVDIGDIGVLPVERDGIRGAIPMPEAQRAACRRHRELLIEGTVSRCLGPWEAAIAVD